jgi:hypothetical protein
MAVITSSPAMGFKRRKGKGRKNVPEQGSPTSESVNKKPRPASNGDFFDPKERVNASFEAYYKSQEIVPESEWDTFMATLRSPLPSSFRICVGTGYAVCCVAEIIYQTQMLIAMRNYCDCVSVTGSSSAPSEGGVLQACRR